MKHQHLIDQFAAKLDTAGLLIAAVGGAPLIDDFEQRLGFRLPKLFRRLVTRYTFQPFEWGPVAFFGNSETYHPFSLHVASMRDTKLWEVTRQAAFAHFGRPESVNYDPVCFGPAKRDREPPIVQLDHEAILLENRIEVVREIAPGFVDLVQRLLSDGSTPIPIEEWSEEFFDAE